MISFDVIKTVLIPFLSLTGLLAGVILSHIAQEELLAGRKYFVFIYRIIFIVLSLVITYFLSFSLIIAFLLCAIILQVLDFKMSSKYLFLIYYLFFFLGYFISGAHIIIAAILFLYGLPVGTLLRMKNE